MSFAKPAMIDEATAHRVKNMSVPELNTFLYAIYLKGYTAAVSDKLGDVLAAVQKPVPPPGPSETQ